MKPYNEFPSNFPKRFTKYFSRKKEATEFAKEEKSKVEKKGGEYTVDYNGTCSNVMTTGRPMYVLVFVNGVLTFDKDFLTITNSLQEAGRVKIAGYEQVFKNMSNFDADVYVDYDFQNDKEVLAKIKELRLAGRKEYLKHELLTRPSMTLIKSLTQDNWGKAKELGYI